MKGCHKVSPETVSAVSSEFLTQPELRTVLMDGCLNEWLIASAFVINGDRGTSVESLKLSIMTGKLGRWGRSSFGSQHVEWGRVGVSLNILVHQRCRTFSCWFEWKRKWLADYQGAPCGRPGIHIWPSILGMRGNFIYQWFHSFTYAWRLYLILPGCHEGRAQLCHWVNGRFWRRWNSHRSSGRTITRGSSITDILHQSMLKLISFVANRVSFLSSLDICGFNWWWWYDEYLNWRAGDLLADLGIEIRGTLTLCKLVHQAKWSWCGDRDRHKH